MQTPRRDALPMPALANPLVNDAGLLGKIQDFRASYAEWRETWGKDVAQRDRINAMPGVPDRSADGYLDFCRAHEQFDFYTPACAQLERLGEMATEIFDTPAMTAKGVLAKARFWEMASNDDDIDAYQVADMARRLGYKDGWWFSSLLVDLEALAGKEG